MKLFVKVLIILLLTSSCLDNDTADNTPSIEFRKEKFCGNDISYMLNGSYDIISLETDSSCLIANIDKLEFRKDMIVVGDYLAKSVFMFSYDGRLLNKIQKIGKGPGEYLGITDMTSTDSTITIIDRFTRRKIVYDTSGTCLSSSDLLKDIWAMHIFHLNDELCFYNEYGNTGSGNYLLFTQKEKIAKYIPFDYECKWIRMVNKAYSIHKGIAKLVYSGNDTIYEYNSAQGAIAKYVFDFGKNKFKFGGVDYEEFTSDYNNGKILGVCSVFETDQYIINKIDVVGDGYMSVYDKNINDYFFCDTPFVIEDFCGFDMDLTDTYENKLVIHYQPAVLKMLYQNKYSQLSSVNVQFKRDLATICGDLHDDDNPVIFIFDMKAE